MTIRFHLPCDPPTANHQRKKIVRIKTRDGRQFTKLADKPELLAAKSTLDALLLPHQPAAAIEGPVRLVIEYTWPWLSAHGKRIRGLQRIPHTSRPDLTNVTKTLEDRLVALRFIEDDRKVVDLVVRKWWGSSPGIEIAIAPFTVRPVLPIEARADLFALVE